MSMNRIMLFARPTNAMAFIALRPLSLKRGDFFGSEGVGHIFFENLKGGSKGR